VYTSVNKLGGHVNGFLMNSSLHLVGQKILMHVLCACLFLLSPRNVRPHDIPSADGCSLARVAFRLQDLQQGTCGGWK